MKLPSIHTLLNPAPPSPPTYDVNDHSYSQKQQTLPAPPSVQVLPASPGPLSVDTMALSPMLSPALSSNRSPSVSSVGSISPMTMNMSDFPPIHGDDPPPRRRPIQSTPLLQPRTPANYLHQHKRSFSQGDKPLYADSHSDQGMCAVGPTTLPTPPTSFSSPSPPPSIVISPSASENKHSNRTTTTNNNNNNNLLRPTTNNRKSRQSTATKGVKQSGPAPPPCTEILISPTGQPILKRRRGRPPTRSPGYEEGGWTFLSPTVWDVASPSSSSPSSSLSAEQQQQYDRRVTAAEDEGMMNDAMTAFTSADMDTVLPMPKKKRGRKPKTHIEGNSCFVWKDIAASKRTTKPMSDMV